MSDVIENSPDVLSGATVFKGTRVPVRALIDCLVGGDSIEEFLQGYPSVTRDQVIQFLNESTDPIDQEAA